MVKSHSVSWLSSAIMIEALILWFAVCLSTVSSLIVCRLSETERVTCPDDFYCCGVDQCCKLKFPDEDKTSSKERRESFDDWVTAFCVRTVLVSAFMVILFVIGKTVQHCRRRYCAKCCSEEGSLPKYKPLEKPPVGPEIGGISKMLGTPFYHVSTERLGSFRDGVPI